MGKLVEYLCEVKDGDGSRGLPVPPIEVLGRMAAAFGCRRGTLVDEDIVTFETLRSYLLGEDAAPALWRGVADTLCSELGAMQYSGRPRPNEMHGVEWICKQCGLDYAALLDEATKAKKEPASWSTNK